MIVLVADDRFDDDEFAARVGSDATSSRIGVAHAVLRVRPCPDPTSAHAAAELFPPEIL